HYGGFTFGTLCNWRQAGQAATFGFSANRAERQPPNQCDPWREARPVPAELCAGGRVCRLHARFRSEDRMTGVDRIGAKRPDDLHEVGLIERPEVGSWEWTKDDVRQPRLRDGAHHDLPTRN